MKHLLVLVLFALLVMQGNAQSFKKLQNDTVVWKSDSSLSRDDFKGKPRGKNIGGATTSGLILYTREVEGNVVFVVEAVFVKSKSFLQGESEYVLNHERRHFDLAELFARKLRKKIASFDFLKVRNVQDKINKAYNQVVEELLREQEKYDRETENGINMARQNLWNEKIAVELAALIEFASPEVNIVRK